MDFSNFSALKSLLSKEEKHVGGKFSEESFESSLKLLLTNNSVDSEDVRERTNQGVLKFFLPNEGINDNLEVQIERLKKLGYAGTLQTQQIFTKAMRIMFSTSANNKKHFFESKDGRELLRRLLWCTSFEDLKTRNDAKQALLVLSTDLEGYFSCKKMYATFCFDLNE